MRFKAPVCITQVQVGDANPAGMSQAPLLRVFARDIHCSCSSRFAPLCSSTISCSEGSTSTYKTEVRGNYHPLA